MVVLLSDTADKKRKMENSFRNTSYEKKLFKVKSIKRWVMNAIKRKKKNEMIFHCSIAQITSEICGISRRRVFNIKRANSSSKFRKKKPSILTTLSKEPYFVWFSVFLQTIVANSGIRHDICRMQTITGLFSYQ